jgi:hypothetical protein
LVNLLFVLCTQDMGTADPRLGALRSPASILQSPGRLPPRGPNMNCTTSSYLTYFTSVVFQVALFLGQTR